MRYRRNPTNLQTLIDFVRSLRSEKMDRLADLIVRYQDDADVAPVLAKVADKVVERIAAKAAREAAAAEAAAPAALTDRQAWKRPEGLAGSVGEKKGWPGELINALKAVFAKRAAEAS